MIPALATGVLFGLSAGFAPGPLLALVISQTLRHGLGHGIRVALAPLLTDLPIVIICVAFVTTLSGSETALGLIALVGSGFVGWLAWDTWRAQPPDATVAAAEAPRSWRRGFMVNLLSPHPWLTWIAVGAPTLRAAIASDGPAAGAAYVVGFYACLVGAKVGVAWAVARARGRLAPRGYRWIMRGLAVLLAVFAAGLLREAVRLRPFYEQGHDNLGAVLLEGGRPEEAIAHFDDQIATILDEDSYAAWIVPVVSGVVPLARGG